MTRLRNQADVTAPVRSRKLTLGRQPPRCSELPVGSLSRFVRYRSLIVHGASSISLRSSSSAVPLWAATRQP